MSNEKENDNNEREVEITEADYKDFKAFQVQQQAKKSRAQKKRITKAGNPDKRSESSKANVSKAREKVKEYLSMSKAVMDEDTDEEYIEIAVKKNRERVGQEKKPVKYMDTRDVPSVKKEVLGRTYRGRSPSPVEQSGTALGIATERAGGTSSALEPKVASGGCGEPVPPIIQPKKTNSFLKF